MKTIVTDLVKGLAPTILVSLTCYCAFSPWAKMADGNEKDDISAAILAQYQPSDSVEPGRNESFEWLSHSMVLCFERNMRRLSNPLLPMSFGALKHIVNNKIGIAKDDGWKSFFTYLAVGLVGILLFWFCGKAFLKPYEKNVNESCAEGIFMGCLLAGMALGLSQVGQLAMQWYALPFLGYCISALFLALSIFLAIIELFKSKLWAIMILPIMVYGFALGVFTAAVGTFVIALVIIIGIFLIALAAAAIALKPEPKMTATLSDGTVLEKENGDMWRDSSGNQWRNVYGDTFERV